MKIEDHPAFSEKLPRICSVLCPENPLKVGETFEFEGEKYRMEKGGVSYDDNSTLWPPLQALYDMINHPEKIIRRPQFSDDEKALMRLYVANGRPIFKPDKNDEGHTVAWNREETLGNGLPKGLLSQITDRFDAAAYLESEESK